MKRESYRFLEELILAPSPSGFEAPAQAVVRKRIKPICEALRTDVHGNLIGTINEEGRPRVMLAGHVDQVGFMVQYVTDDGFIHFDSIGGVDAGILAGQIVSIHGKAGPVSGVVGKKPIHLLEKEERQKAPKIQQLWIDTGARSKKETLKAVSVGDPITFRLGVEKLKGNLIAAAGFDDKVGSFVVAEVLRELKGRRFKAAVFGVSTVQEEVGLRGARTSAFGIEPDIGIAVDVGFATDFPDIDKRLIGEAKLGQGPIVYLGPNINPAVGKRLLDVARRKRIPVQVKGAPKPTGTDANVIQITRSGVAAGLIGIPDRYLHMPAEVVSLADLDTAVKLLVSFIESLSPDDSFIP